MSTKPICMIPGPIECHERVLAAAGHYSISHISPLCMAAYSRALRDWRHVVDAESGSQPFIVAGSGTLGWDMLTANLVETQTIHSRSRPLDTILVFNTGVFGTRWVDCARQSYGVHVIDVPTRPGTVHSKEKIEESVRNVLLDCNLRLRLVCLTHVDTSTGTRTNVGQVASWIRHVIDTTETIARSPRSEESLHEEPVLIACDGVCSIAGEFLSMTESGLDIVMTASQKAIGAPPGLCLVMVGPRAMRVHLNLMARLQSAGKSNGSFYASWQRWLPIMQAYEAQKPSYFATPPVPLILAVSVALRQLIIPLEEGDSVPMDTVQGMEVEIKREDARKQLAIRFEQHKATAERVRQHVLSLGLKLVPENEENTAHTLTACYHPRALDLVAACAKQGVVIAGGLHPDIGPSQYFRIGHMGLSAVDRKRGDIDRTLKALTVAIQSLQ